MAFEDLGRRLEQRFGFERALVTLAAEDEGRIAALIGAATGATLQDVLGDGDLWLNSTLGKSGFLNREDMSSRLRAGAVGDILCRFVSEDGEVPHHPLNHPVISADPTMLRGSRRIVLASGGGQAPAGVIPAAVDDDLPTAAGLRSKNTLLGRAEPGPVD